MPGPTFVTGGSGFVGGAVLRWLVAEGRDVRALARSPGSAATVEAAGARAVRGDLFDEDALADGMRGCDSVFHVAGVNAMCRRDPAAMLRANVDGTGAVIRAAAVSGVGRVVHTSSAATIGEPEGVIGREDTPHRGGFLSSYERSKFLAEERAFALGHASGIDVVSVNPSSVQGPGRTGGSARLLIGLVDARLACVIDTFVSVVDVDDCAAGHLLAERAGIPGNRYVLNGASLTTRAAVALVRSIAERPRHVVTLPRATASLAGAAARLAAHATGRDLSFCPELARTLLHGHRYDGSLATRGLGLVYRPVAETMERTLRWYADRGLIRPIERLADVP